MPNHRAAKRLWKVCVEHHTFFRLLLPEAPPKKFLTLGSKFRYSGRTQAQTRRASALIDRPAPYFERSSSKRYTMSRSLDGASVNENHEMYMKDSVSAAEVGTGQYATTKGISQTNLITTVTPEKKAEEEKDDEEGKKKRAEEVTPISAVRHDTKRIDTTTSQEVTSSELKQAAQPHQDAVTKVVQETVVIEERRGMNVHASGDPASVAGLADAQAQAASASAKGKEGSAVTKGAKEEKREAHKAVTKQEGIAAATSHEQAEEHSTTVHVSDSLERKPRFESPVVKTETISFSSVSTGGENLEISTKEVPVVHTETKTITYESSQVDSGADSEPGVLMSAQTITSETTSTTTTTHITKTVKGGISETRIEKRIVITGDADIDHDQALAQAIKEAKEQHPDMSVTKVVVHKETEITPEDGED